MRRRDFLKASAVAAGVALLEGCARREVEYLEQRVAKGDGLPGQSVYKVGVCGQCVAGCGLVARTVDGEARKLEGLPESPVSHGGLCALGQAGVQALYHPDRVTTPLVRRDGALAATTWEDALGRAGEILAAALAEDPRSLALVSDRAAGPLPALLRRFARAAGADAPLALEPPEQAAERQAAARVFGLDDLPVYDLARADYVLSIGTPFADRWGSPVHYAHALGQLRRGRPGRRGKLVQAEPRMSNTAAVADEWLPTKPGTEGLLARGMAAAILEGSLASDAAVAAYRTVFPREPLPVAAAASACDVPAETIRRIARELAEAENGVVLGGGSAGRSPDGVAHVAAAQALNLLIGSLGRPGGVYAPDRFGVASRIEGEAQGETGSLPTRQLTLTGLAARVSGSAGPPVRAVLTVEADLLHRTPASWKLRQSLESRSIPVVALASFLDDTAARADVVLPLQADLERWQMVEPEVPVGPPVLALARPVVKPSADVRHPADVLLALAQTLGEPVAGKLPWTGWIDVMESTIREGLPGLPGGGPEASFWDVYGAALDRGGFWGEGLGPAPPGPAGPVAEPRVPDAGDAAETPFELILFRSVKTDDGRGAHLPWLQQLPDSLATVMWGSWVQISPRDAAELGIETGDRVAIASPHGTVEVPAVLDPAARPGTVALPLGQGHERYGRWAEGRGVNPLDLLGTGEVEETGMPAHVGTRARVRRLAGGTVALFGAGLRRAEDLPRGRPVKQAGILPSHRGKEQRT